MTAEIITPGHVKCITWLQEHCDFLIIGLLTEKALKGYKKCVVPYADRKTVLEAIINIYDKVVPQDNLDPEVNLKRYKADAIASGDGWEAAERKAISRLNIEAIDIPLPKEWSSTKVKQLIKETT